ncbi:hypothetical protein ACFWBC_10320 [Streptomyces sp. NPDC059985]|uniref:hypothetical protein n=1 Tax=Streptomyces sp. NPDC059985 TaxID=3347025 RepID=UPI00369C7F60
MARFDVITHRMPSLQSVAKEYAVTTTHEELCDEETRERMALTLLADQGAWMGLDPEHTQLAHLIRTTLTDAADAAQRTFGPDSRYRVVLELLAGAPHGDRIEYASNRTELITD